MSRGTPRRRWRGLTGGLLFIAPGLLTPAGDCGKLAAQLRLEHFDVTAGAAAERYTGKFSIVTVPIVDSAAHAIAGASEWAFTSSLGLLSRPNRTLTLAADGSLRQLATAGFHQRNYAPREHSYRVTALYQENMAGGTLRLIPAVEGRSVADLPPMPLYLTPGNLAYSARATFARPIGGRYAVDVGMAVNEKDYAGPSVLPDLDLLDFRSLEAEAGVARRFRGSAGPSDVRLFLAYLRHRYFGQGHRSDNAVRIGGSWQLDLWEAKGLQIGLQHRRDPEPVQLQPRGVQRPEGRGGGAEEPGGRLHRDTLRNMVREKLCQSPGIPGAGRGSRQPCRPLR